VQVDPESDPPLLIMMLRVLAGCQPPTLLAGLVSVETPDTSPRRRRAKRLLGALSDSCGHLNRGSMREGARTVAFSRLLRVAIVVVLFAACDTVTVTTLEDPRSDSGGVDPDGWIEGWNRCLTAGGAEVEFSNIYGTWEAVAGPGMTEGEMAALWAECRPGPFPVAEPDPERTRRVYAANLLIRDCLIDLGYQPGPPPSEEVFVEQNGVWDPYEGLHQQYSSHAEQLEVEKTCPPWVGRWMDDSE